MLYRHKRGPTDVISFAFEEAGVFVQPKGNDVRYLGEVYICIPIVARNARKYGRKKEDELKYVYVHSLLHLWGYDHKTERARKRMDCMAENILIGIT
jgi:probable rRNA maturation factor